MQPLNIRMPEAGVAINMANRVDFWKGVFLRIKRVTS